MDRRVFLSISGASALGLSAEVKENAPKHAGKWYQRLTAGVHLDYHYPDWDPHLLSKSDGAAMIQTIAATDAELVVVFAKCHYGNAYYNTRIGHKHKNLADR